MARILFAWELGMGYGHIMPYRDLAKALVERGHEVAFASRDLYNTQSVFGDCNVTFIQSPALYGKVKSPNLPGHSYIDVLHNAGFSEDRHLAGRFKAWRYLFEAIKPDLAIFDAAPIASLVARSFPCRRITSGTGFFVPPRTSPMPALRFWIDESRVPLADQEQTMIETVNRVLTEVGSRPIRHLYEVIEADDTFLMNFKELDHYPDRPDGDYLGSFPAQSFGAEFDWPASKGKKVFAYLHPFKTLPSLFESMTRLGVCAVVYGPDIRPQVKERFESDSIHFVDQPVNVNVALEQCDLAVTNGTLSSSVSVLLAGKPLLALPNTLERQIVSIRIQQLGAGLAAPQLKPGGMASKLQALLGMPRFEESARRFAARYGSMNKAWQVERMLEKVDNVLAATTSGIKRAGT